VKTRTAVNIALFVLLLAAGGFLAYRKLRKHDAVMSVSAADCKGVVEVEHAVFEDEERVAGGNTRLGDPPVSPTTTASWKSPTLSHRAGAQFTVLARGACKSLSCQIVIDGQIVGQGGVRDKDQVTCTAMVGN
jgi:hypothetical protein